MQSPRGRKIVLDKDGRLYFAGSTVAKMGAVGGSLYSTNKLGP